MMLLSRIFSSSKKSANQSAPEALSFDGLNPLLAKQLTELETQIGRFAQMQFEISRERESMRIEMAEIKKVVQSSARSDAQGTPNDTVDDQTDADS